jgi:hypothetical protein
MSASFSVTETRLTLYEPAGSDKEERVTGATRRFAPREETSARCRAYDRLSNTAVVRRKKRLTSMRTESRMSRPSKSGVRATLDAFAPIRGRSSRASGRRPRRSRGTEPAATRLARFERRVSTFRLRFDVQACRRRRRRARCSLLETAPALRRPAHMLSEVSRDNAHGVFRRFRFVRDLVPPAPPAFVYGAPRPANGLARRARSSSRHRRAP